MAKGSYNISIPNDSNLQKRGSNNNEAELEERECINSCLNTAFLRSLSFHDRPRSSRVPTNKEFHCTRYKALASSSLENIPYDLLPTSEGKSKYNKFHCFESTRVDAKTDSPQQTDQNILSGGVDWFEDGHTGFGTESEKLLEKTITILRDVDKDISESLANLTKPESIALESVKEIYGNRGKSSVDCSGISEFNFSVGVCSPKSIDRNREAFCQQRFHVQTTLQRPNNSQSVSPRQSLDSFHAHCSQESPRNSLDTCSIQRTNQCHSAQQTLKGLQSPSAQQTPNSLQSHSAQQTPNSLQSHSAQQTPNSLQSHSAQQTPNSLQSHSVQQTPNSLQSHSAQQTPNRVQSHFDQQTPKRLQSNSAQQTSKNLRSQLNSNSGKTQSLSLPDWNNLRSVEESPINVLSSPKRIAVVDSTEVKPLHEFDLPSDHEQFVKVIGALQVRCLEYTEMIQDIAISALETCLNFSESPINGIRHLRKQFESQKMNFRDFKELCCRSVVFGPESLPVDERVVEVIQSFYLKLLQEANETFMARLEFGLNMGEAYVKMLEIETESKKIIATLEKEILYLKKTSVGFKV